VLAGALVALVVVGFVLITRVEPRVRWTDARSRRVWRGLAVLLFTGLVQTVAEPVRQFVTPMFWAKMLMIILVATLTALYATAVRRNAALWDAASSRPWPAKIFAVLSTLLWLAIIVCGRFIGYTWSFYA